jgi:hypothetical protein
LARTSPQKLSDPARTVHAMATWVPMPCPVEGCSYIAQFQLKKTKPPNDKTADPYDERTYILQALSDEHQANVERGEAPHPGGVDALVTDSTFLPAEDD